MGAWEVIDPSFDHAEWIAALRTFPGLRRRTEYLGKTAQWTPVYSDYGHHPDAFDRIIPDMQESFSAGRAAIVFEPHQAQRLLALWDDFRDSLEWVDDIAIFTPYTAREDRNALQALLQEHIGTQTTSPDDLGEAFADAVGGVYLPDQDALASWLANYEKNDIIMTMSAGQLDSMMRKLSQ